MNEEYELRKENAELREVLKKVHKAFCDGLIGAHSIATDAEADALFRLWHEEIPAVLPPDDEDEEDFFSPTSWDKDPFESDEEYLERIQDQEDWLESLDD